MKFKIIIFQRSRVFCDSFNIICIITIYGYVSRIVIFILQHCDLGFTHNSASGEAFIFIIYYQISDLATFSPRSSTNGFHPFARDPASSLRQAKLTSSEQPGRKYSFPLSFLERKLHLLVNLTQTRSQNPCFKNKMRIGFPG